VVQELAGYACIEEDEPDLYWLFYISDGSERNYGLSELGLQQAQLNNVDNELVRNVILAVHNNIVDSARLLPLIRKINPNHPDDQLDPNFSVLLGMVLADYQEIIIQRGNHIAVELEWRRVFGEQYAETMLGLVNALKEFNSLLPSLITTRNNPIFSTHIACVHCHPILRRAHIRFLLTSLGLGIIHVQVA